jgi:hypothetical protein
MTPNISRELICDVQGCLYGPLSDHDGNPVCLRCGAVDSDESEGEPQEVEQTCRQCLSLFCGIAHADGLPFCSMTCEHKWVMRQCIPQCQQAAVEPFSDDVIPY